MTSSLVTRECLASQKGSHDCERANITFQSRPLSSKPAVYWDPRTIKFSLSKKKNAFLQCIKKIWTNRYVTEGHFLCATQIALSLCADPLNFFPLWPSGHLLSQQDVHIMRIANVKPGVSAYNNWDAAPSRVCVSVLLWLQLDSRLWTASHLHNQVRRAATEMH